MSTAIATDDIVATWSAVGAEAREPLVVVEPLREFMDARGLGEGDLSFAPIGDGHSNVTYEVRRGEERFVLRRPPRGPLPPSAHDVLREARIVAALDGRTRVPRILARGEDPATIGAPFYLMQLVAGFVLDDSLPPELAAPERRRAVGLELVDALVELHEVDWRAAGLGEIGREHGYLERQLRRFTGLWDHNKTRDLPAVEAVGAWLARNMPPEAEATVVHGDYRLGNVLFAAGPEPRLTAVLDWELATIGDPLADLGYLSVLWTDREDPDLGVFEIGPVTREPGFPGRDELVARYAERSGRGVEEIRWYEALALWKAIVFMEGNYKRSLAGSSDDPYMREFGEGIPQMAERAQVLIAG